MMDLADTVHNGFIVQMVGIIPYKAPLFQPAANGCGSIPVVYYMYLITYEKFKIGGIINFFNSYKPLFQYW